MATVTTLQSRLDTKKDQLDLANETYSKILTKVNRSYTFETALGDEATAAKQRLKDLREEITYLEAEILRLEQQISGGLVANLHCNPWG